jgi:hypothetical protein
VSPRLLAFPPNVIAGTTLDAAATELPPYDVKVPPPPLLLPAATTVLTKCDGNGDNEENPVDVESLLLLPIDGLLLLLLLLSVVLSEVKIDNDFPSITINDPPPPLVVIDDDGLLVVIVIK